MKLRFDKRIILTLNICLIDTKNETLLFAGSLPGYGVKPPVAPQESVR
jgi:hypothetical protein